MKALVGRMNKTNIGWTDFSSNPIYAVDKVTSKRGWFCERVSPGCAHCYASTLNGRWGNGLDYLPANAGQIEFRLDGRELERILKRKKPARIFICDMSDLFHEQMPDEFIAAVFSVMAIAYQHTFQVLTKRPKRMRDFSRTIVPLPNVWLGISAENQRWADERIPLLLDTPAAVRFVSLEPLLGPICLYHDWLTGMCDNGGCGRHYSAAITRRGQCPCHDRDYAKLSWVIVGGESGPKHRPMDVAWVQRIAGQCDAADVALFVKQDSGQWPGRQGDIPDALWARKEMPR